MRMTSEFARTSSFFTESRRSVSSSAVRRISSKWIPVFTSSGSGAVAIQRSVPSASGFLTLCRGLEAPRSYQLLWRQLQGQTAKEMRSVVAVSRPRLVSANFDRAKHCDPRFRNEAVVNMIWLFGITAEVERWSGLCTLRLAKEVMVGTHKTERRKLLN